MRRSARPARALAAALAACLLLAVPAVGHALLPPVGEEEEALVAVEAGKYTRARELAEQVVSANPDAIAGTWVLGEVFHSWDANHAQALFLMRRAKRLLLAAYGPAPEDDLARIWHKRILRSENYILSEMDRQEEQLAVLDEHDALYAPKLTRLRIWPLIKLGRYDEARAIGEELILSPEYYDRISAYNGLIALEDERLDRQASYDWGKAGIEALQGRSCILFHNTAAAAISLFRFAEGEELARKAITAEGRDCPNSSYEHLATIALIGGDFQRTLSAFRRLRDFPIDRRLRQNFAMSNRAVLVDILYALGHGERGLELAEQMFNAPDRTGMTSVSKDDIRFGHSVSYSQMLAMRMEELREQASARSILQSLPLWKQLRDMRLRQWELTRVVLRLSLPSDRLITNLRPYLRRVRPWYAGNLARIVGPGLARAALAQARARDDGIREVATGYYEALAADIALVSGSPRAAEAHARAALEAMPQATRLLRWRTEAVLAGALLAQGRAEEATPHLREVLFHYPTALRHLELRLPVAITHDESPVAADAARRLARSPRLTIGRGDAFTVHIEASGEELSACLRARDGALLNCGVVDADDAEAAGGDVGALAILVADAFHRTVFAPKVELTSADINSLDGSVVRVNAEHVLEGIVRPTLPGDRRGSR